MLKIIGVAGELTIRPLVCLHHLFLRPMAKPIVARDLDRPSHRLPIWRCVGVAVLFLAAAVGALIGYLVSHAEGLLRTRIVESLSTRFQTRVELSAFHISRAHGLQVSGEGLKIFGRTDPNIHEPGKQPLFDVQEFRFHLNPLCLLRSPLHIQRVWLKGLVINVPPAGQRQEMKAMRGSGKVTLFVDEFVSDSAELVINSANPDKLPLEFDIGSLKMKDIGPDQPLRFETTLVNPKPVGNILSTGLFGPWQADRIRETPVQGVYSFRDADLGTIKGIGGILSSTGKYSGTLERIVADGVTDTSDFRITVSGHPVPLHTEFHAIVDGTSGDTYLQPVRAKLLNSSFVAGGKVVRTLEPKGHSVNLDVSIERSQVQDLLRFGVRTEPPVMSGLIQAKVKLNLPAGEDDLSERLRLAGHFQVSGAHFSNDKTQDKIDALSLRSQGHPELAKEPLDENVRSNLNGTFKLLNGVLSFSALQFQIPGTQVNLQGQYSLDGNTFDFHGKARLDAQVSQMVTGWKSIVLKPVNPFFHKHGAGAEIPVKITGTNSEPHFGLDFRRKSPTAKNRPKMAENSRPPTKEH